MEYSYKEILGKKIEIADLNITRAKSLALAALKNPAYILNPVFIKRDDGAEVIILTLDIEIYQTPQNSIEEREDVAIICHPEDEFFPEVYALRCNFQLGLPHTNLRTETHPVSLCVTEEDFQETKHLFNSFEFIESIRRWLTLTSQNKLHAKDQPLEPFFFHKEILVVPELKKVDLYNFIIEKYTPNSCFYKILTKDNSDGLYFSIPVKVDEKVSGYIHKQPQTLEDLKDVFLINNVDISTYLANQFNAFTNDFLSDKTILEKRIAILCIIPVKRQNTDINPERTDMLIFVTQELVKKIGIASGVWAESIDRKSVVKIIGKSFSRDSFEKVKIELYSPIDDFSKNNAAFFNNIKPNDNKFFLIGAGALGSQVLSLFARMGYGFWTVIDYDILYPHNVARHALSRDSVGCSKVEKLSEQLNYLVGDNFCKPINANFIQVSKDEEIIACLKESRAIIDISTSIAVGRLLARDYSDEITTRRISSFLNPSGNDLIILAEDEKRNHRLDFLEMEYYRFLYRNEKLNDHLVLDEGLTVRYIRNSCRELTRHINQSNITIHASICAKAIMDITEKREATISIWRINSDDYTIQKYSTQPTKWEKICKDEWKIYINKTILEEMQFLRLQKLPKETGGILIGTIDNERKVIYIFDTLSAPEDSKETPTSFERGIIGIIDEYKKYKKITGNQIQYLGEWHSHPNNCSIKPSNLDMSLFSYLFENLSRQGYPTIMAIIGDTNYSLTISL